MARTRLPGTTGTVYGLVDPITNQVRYVGQTSLSPEKRLYLHLNKCELEKESPKNIWLKGLLTQGLKPGILILEVCSGPELTKAEVRWIETYRNQDCGLTNLYTSKDKRNVWLETFNPPKPPARILHKLSEERLAQIDREKEVISRMLRNGHRTSIYY